MAKIKICGITNPELAYETARAGADFIGLVFVPSSRRAVTVQTAAAIADAARKGGAVPVGVFTEANAESILNICKTTDIQWVQLHGKQSRATQHLLPTSLHRIYVHQIAQAENFQLNGAAGSLDLNRDYLLFDNEKGGSGKTFDWAKFSYSGDFRWFLSGGLNVGNVKEAIASLKPTAVDVSSGVENTAGEKTLKLIKQFILEARI